LAEAAAASVAAVVPSVVAAPLGAGDMLTQADHEQISAAIAEIEKKTSGDIYCIIAKEASNYREVPLVWAALIALLLPILVLAGGLRADVFLKGLEGWSVVPLRDIGHWLLIWALLQSLVFAAIALLVSIPALRRALTPHFLKRHRVSALARQHFVSTGLHLEDHQPHVVIFLALAERIVEILADPALHRLAGEKVWETARDAVVSAMRSPDPTSGLVAAIHVAGGPLVAHFPANRSVQHREGLAEL
jgi:putative membrane protein